MEKTINFTAVLFDLDGTLIDPKIGITESVRYAMVQMGQPIPADENIDWCIGPPLQENFARLLQTEEKVLVDTAVSQYRVRYSKEGLFEATVYDGVPEMLASLREQNYRVLLATSKPHIYAREILAHFDLIPFFDAVYGSEMNGRNAHKADLIRHVLQEESLSPGTAAMIGDREHDILGAKANGVWAGGVLYGYGRRAEIQHAQPDHTFATPQSISQFFTQLQKPS